LVCEYELLVLTHSTALMLAASDGRFSLVKLLTESKADPEVKDSSNFKAMDYAVTQNHQE